MLSKCAKRFFVILASWLPTTKSFSATSKTTSLHSTLPPPQWPPQTPMDLSRTFRKVFSDLERPGPFYSNVSPTLRFSYVTPPINGTSTWNNHYHEVPEDLLYRDPSKPIAVYLPGLDGYGLSAFRSQFDDLADTFELWRLTVLPEDRSPFMEVVGAVSDFVDDVAKDGRRVTLIAESCGGLFATAVALRLQRRVGKRNRNPLQGLVLANPATAFDKTPLDTLAPVLTSLQFFGANGDLERRRGTNGLTPYSVIGSLFLASVIPDNDQYRRIFDLIAGLPTLDLPVTDVDQIREIWDATSDSFRAMEERLPPELIEHRLSWTSVGSTIVNPRIKDIELPTLVVVGDEDKLLPSAQEADLLLEQFPSSEKLLVKGRGHVVLDENVNLTEAILFSKIDPLNWKETKQSYDPILDWEFPSDERMDKVEKGSLKQYRDAHSPVFFSTDSNGKRWLGLSRVPRSEGPLLFVGNHQFAGLDLTMLLGQLNEDRNIFARGLAHPVAFLRNNITELRGRVPGLVDTGGGSAANFQEFQEFGAVPVSPRNFYRLMQTGQDALLFPGGVKEALSGDKGYPLFWPEKVDFVRTAARFNATIVPVSAIGMLEGVNVVAERATFLAPDNDDSNVNLRAARYDQKERDDLVPPLAVPGVPARNYFLFCQPICTRDVDPNDKDECARVYEKARNDVRKGIDDLLQAREKDPFGATLRRVAFERLTGRKAPTFSVDHLN